MQYPEHTAQSYAAAAHMGAGIIECDVAFTKDKELVCRHAQNDLATTTDILVRPELAAKCTKPFTPADPANGVKASAECRSSDITLVTAENGKYAPSVYTKAAMDAGLDIITWTLERSGPLTSGGGWYYQTTNDITTTDGDMFELLDVLAKEVKVLGVFSDWPATTTYYANCAM